MFYEKLLNRFNNTTLSKIQLSEFNFCSKEITPALKSNTAKVVVWGIPS